MILLYGSAREEPMAAVYAALARRGAPVFFVERSKLLQTSIQLSVGSHVTGVVRVGRRKIELENVASAYLRLFDPCELPNITGAARNGLAWKHALGVQEAFESWADVTPARVVNRTSARGWCDSKPFQSRRIRSLGFDYPETLLTTDPEAALRFWRRHENVIYKSVSFTRSIVARLTPAHRRRLSDLRWCPTQFQQYIPGTEYRVHVIGRSVFACEIVSKAVDYRYAEREGMSAGVRPARLPAAITNRCRLLAADRNFFVAGIDLRRTPGGRWYCFEVNPSPAFTSFEYGNKPSMADAMARLLMCEPPVRAVWMASAKKFGNPVGFGPSTTTPDTKS
jgi:hypothetical protein